MRYGRPSARTSEAAQATTTLTSLSTPHRRTQAFAACTPDSAGDIASKSDAGAPDEFAPHNAPR